MAASVPYNRRNSNVSLLGMVLAFGNTAQRRLLVAVFQHTDNTVILGLFNDTVSTAELGPACYRNETLTEVFRLFFHSWAMKIRLTKLYEHLQFLHLKHISRDIRKRFML
jgi:hypothetical protein